MAEDKTYRYWRKVLEKERKAHDTYRKQAKDAEEAARNDGDRQHPYCIQWSNCKIVRSAIFGSRPKPDVRRRYQKPDPEEKELAKMVERAIEYQVDSNDFDGPSSATVKDFVEVGLGVPRVIYDVTTQPLEGMEDGEEIVAQSVGIEHIPWKHFHWEPGKAWVAVDWIAIESFRPQKEVEETYDVEISGGKDDDSSKRDSEEYTEEVQIYEIYHKPSRKIYVLAPTHPEILEVRDDKLSLQGFYPIPRPLFANLKSDELIPKPDYCFIEPQIKELNRVTQRLNSLYKQIKPNGFYDASLQDLAGLADAPDGTLKPVAGLGQQAQGSPQNAVQYLPFGEKIAAARELEQQREEIKQQVYEIVGISDIIRGSSKASETAAAQTIKGQWANVRLSEKTNDVARLWREVFRMFAEIICEHFRPEILQLQTGVEITPRMQQIMTSDIGRSFAIDVETDSTIAKDDFEARQQAADLVNAILANMEKTLPAVQAGLMTPTFVQELLLFVANKHKGAKQLEDSITELGPHLQSLQQFQQKMQGLQQELMKRDQALQGQGQQIQGMQKALSQFNEREEARKDAETRAKVEKEKVDTDAQRIENQIVSTGLDVKEQAADVRKTHAETNKIEKETALMGFVNG